MTCCHQWWKNPATHKLETCQTSKWGVTMTTSTKLPARPAETEAQEIPKSRKFTVDEYYRMAEVGILHPEERVELINGEIIAMAPIGPLHAETVEHWSNAIKERIPHPYIVRSQNPVTLGENLQPIPDLAIVRRRTGGYYGSHPEPDEIIVVIEVSDSSLAHDRDVKVPLYAQANIPETWLMNLVEDCIESFTGPGPNGYANHTIYRRGDRISPSTLPDVEFAVDDLLPPAPQAQDTEAPDQEERQS